MIERGQAELKSLARQLGRRPDVNAPVARAREMRNLAEWIYQGTLSTIGMFDLSCAARLLLEDADLPAANRAFLKYKRDPDWMEKPAKRPRARKAA